MKLVIITTFNAVINFLSILGLKLSSRMCDSYAADVICVKGKNTLFSTPFHIKFVELVASHDDIENVGHVNEDSELDSKQSFIAKLNGKVHWLDFYVNWEKKANIHCFADNDKVFFPRLVRYFVVLNENSFLLLPNITYYFVL
jgi:hypothetical protein